MESRTHKGDRGHRSTFMSPSSRALLPSSSTPFALRLALLSLVWLCAAPSLVSAAVMKGVASFDDGDYFLGRFCFDYDPSGQTVGQVQIVVTDPNYNSDSEKAIPLQYALYSDEDNSWPEVLAKKDSLSCQGKYDMGKPYAHASFPPPQGDSSGLAQTIVPISQGLRPRFWFAVVYSCNDEHGIRPIQDLQWEIHFTNVQQSDWDKEFGTNERGLNSMYLTFLIVFSLFFVLHFIGVHRLRKQLDFIHPVRIIHHSTAYSSVSPHHPPLSPSAPELMSSRLLCGRVFDLLPLCACRS